MKNCFLVAEAPGLVLRGVNTITREDNRAFRALRLKLLVHGFGVWTLDGDADCFALCMAPGRVPSLTGALSLTCCPWRRNGNATSKVRRLQQQQNVLHVTWLRGCGWITDESHALPLALSSAHLCTMPSVFASSETRGRNYNTMSSSRVSSKGNEIDRFQTPWIPIRPPFKGPQTPLTILGPESGQL